MGRYALAVAHVKTPAAGLAEINNLEAYMKALKIDPKTNPEHWKYFARDKALVLEMTEDHAAALKALEREPDENGKAQPPQWPLDYERIRKKRDAAQP